MQRKNQESLSSAFFFKKKEEILTHPFKHMMYVTKNDRRKDRYNL